jgi:hypothetical protein
MNRFHKTEINTYRKYITIGDIHYSIDVPCEIWDTVKHSKISDHIRYWKRNPHINIKYGTATKIHSIPERCEHTCVTCKKKYKTRTGLLKHMKTHHNQTDTIMIEAPYPREITQTIENHTINQTNNIQQNITIRPFGKENPRWITEKVIIESLRNISGAIMNLVREKHFNDNFPENRNIEMCSEFRNRYLTVQEETRKKVVDRKSIFMKMCDNACDAVTTTLESYSEPLDNDDIDEDTETEEDRHCRQVANCIRRSRHFSTVVDQYIDKWQDYISSVELDGVMKDADHYITMLLLDLKLALAHEEELINERD